MTMATYKLYTSGLEPDENVLEVDGGIPRFEANSVTEAKLQAVAFIDESGLADSISLCELVLVNADGSNGETVADWFAYCADCREED